MSSFLRPVLILVVASAAAIAASVSIIFAADLFVPGFTARADNYALGVGIPLCVAPTLFYPLVRINYRMQLVKAELERMVRTDALTGLPNRRAFFEEAGRVFAAPEYTPAAVMMADIDHFKQINDRYGHATGDEVLRHVAKVIARAARGGPGEAETFVARLGGEEFVILLAGADAKQTMAVAERVCDAVRGSALRRRSGSCAATVSIGVAVRRPGVSLDAVMRAADKAGYEAKRLGRDRWVVAETTSLPCNQGDESFPVATSAARAA